MAAVEFIINSLGTSEASSNNMAYTATVTSIFYGYESIVDLLVTKTEIDVNTQGVTGNTMLMWSCIWGNYNLANYFIKQGADVSLINERGQTALSLAYNYGHIDIANLLLSYGAA
eukprot:gene19414-25290_t